MARSHFLLTQIRLRDKKRHTSVPSRTIEEVDAAVRADGRPMVN